MKLPRLHMTLTAPGMGPVRIVQLSLGLATAILILAIGWLWWEVQQVEAEILTREEALAQVKQIYQDFLNQSEAEGFNLSDQHLLTLPRKVTFANQLSTHNTFSWTQFLNDLESAVPPRISMESVTVNFKDSSIALSGSALTLKDLSALVNGLEDHSAFQKVVLSSHKLQKPFKKDKTTIPSFVLFSLEVVYQPSS